MNYVITKCGHDIPDCDKRPSFDPKAVRSYSVLRALGFCGEIADIC
jgi:hypothetical protein